MQYGVDACTFFIPFSVWYGCIQASYPNLICLQYGYLQNHHASIITPIPHPNRPSDQMVSQKQKGRPDGKQQSPRRGERGSTASLSRPGTFGTICVRGDARLGSLLGAIAASIPASAATADGRLDVTRRSSEDLVLLERARRVGNGATRVSLKNNISLKRKLTPR